jgi:hypothetical protein
MIAGTQKKQRQGKIQPPLLFCAIANPSWFCSENISRERDRDFTEANGKSAELSQIKQKQMVW